MIYPPSDSYYPSNTSFIAEHLSPSHSDGSTLQVSQSAIIRIKLSNFRSSRNRIPPDMLEWWLAQPGGHQSSWHQGWPEWPRPLLLRRLPWPLTLYQQQVTDYLVGWMEVTRTLSQEEHRRVCCEKIRPMTVNEHRLSCSNSQSCQQDCLTLHTHTHLTALCPGLPGWAGTRKVKPIWILLKLETVSGSGISWAICKSAPRSRQKTMPAPHHSVFLQARCPSCRPSNSVKALKAKLHQLH